jgi:TolA-binding protein
LSAIEHVLGRGGESSRRRARLATIDDLRGKALSRQIEQLLVQRRTEDAIARCRTAAAAEPGTAYARTATHLLLRACGQGIANAGLDEMLELFTGQFGANGPNLEYAHYHAAVRCYETSEFELAQTRLDRFCRKFPKSRWQTDARVTQGLCMIRRNDHAQALPTLTRALGEDPDSPRAPQVLFLVAWIQLQLGDIQAAREALERLVARHPDSLYAPKARQLHERLPAHLPE